MDIDLVYLWVDGSDPQWIAKRNARIGTPKETSDGNCKGRYANNDELKYSLRSVEKYAPWIHKIYIVTDNQAPDWLDTTHPKIQIVDHTEIMPPESLPCFNSVIIEHHICNIPGLAEHFLYANDDMLINRPVTPADFFAPDGLPIVKMYRRRFARLRQFFREKLVQKPLNKYMAGIKNAARLVEDTYGIYFGARPHHNIDTYLKSDYLRIRQQFTAQIDATLGNATRSSEDIQRVIYSYVPLAEKRAHLRYVSKKSSFRFRIECRRHYRQYAACNPQLLCMNDSQYASDADRQRAAQFLRNLFPQKSQFEK